MPLIMSQFTAPHHWLRPTIYHYYAFNVCINTQPIVTGSDKKYIIIIMFLNMYKFIAHCQWLRQEVYNNYLCL